MMNYYYISLVMPDKVWFKVDDALMPETPSPGHQACLWRASLSICVCATLADQGRRTTMDGKLGLRPGQGHCLEQACIVVRVNQKSLWLHVNPDMNNG